MWLNMGAGIMTAALGIAYILRSSPMVKDFRLVMAGLRKVLVMGFVCQGLALCFIGAVVVILAAMGQADPSARIVSSLCAGMLLALGIVTGATGGQSEYLIFRIGQFVKVIAAMMIFVGNIPR